jgi:hypothetical protein
MQYMKQQNRCLFCIDVLEYFFEMWNLLHRPYSAIQVFENLHQRISKPMVQRLLDNLATPAADPEAAPAPSSASASASAVSSAEPGLRCKEYGKAKIYFIDQVRSKKQSLYVRFGFIFLYPIFIIITIRSCEVEAAEPIQRVRRGRGEGAGGREGGRARSAAGRLL